MPKLLKSGFEITRFSDVKYERLTTEINFRGVQLAQLSNDLGDGQVIINIYRSAVDNSFSLEDFIEALEEAKSLLS